MICLKSLKFNRIKHMDLLFIDKELSKALTSKILQTIHDAFNLHYEIKSFDVINGEEAFKILNEEKKCGYVGSFAIVANGKNIESFEKEFPNNTIATKEIIDEDEIKRISKQVVWMLNNFGREKKNMTNTTWVVSDSHFYHDNIIRYCNRPYANAIEMNEDMIAKWNAVVGKDDIVWHLGDFAFGSKDHVKEIVSRLNGRINLVMGNHDHHKVSFYYESGFHRVYDHPIVVSNFFILSHEPMQWVKDGDVYANIFGHVHSQELYKDFTSNSFCACVERIGYAPIRWTDMIEKMKSQVIS